MLSGQIDSGNQQFVVATEQNVLAALSIKTGDILWRRILENGERGQIQFFQLTPDTDAGNLALTVTGTTIKLVRGWNCKTGNIAWEWMANQQATGVDQTEHWFLSRSFLIYAVLNRESSNLEITAYDIRSGEIQTERKLAVKSNGHGSCHFSKDFLICSARGNVESINIVSGTAKTVAESSSSPRLFQVI